MYKVKSKTCEYFRVNAIPKLNVLVKMVVGVVVGEGVGGGGGASAEPIEPLDLHLIFLRDKQGSLAHITHSF